MPVRISNAKRLRPDSSLKPFDCGDADLNDFFLNDSLAHLKELLAVTYVLESRAKTIAFFSVLNDRISSEDTDRKSLQKIRKTLPVKKRYRSFPAVKVGRLGVHKDYARTGIGTKILNAIKASFTTNNKTGCRFITVDAYNNECTIKFYLNNGFIFLTGQDKDDATRLMYFDLKRFNLS